MGNSWIVPVAIIGALALGGYALGQKLANTEFSGFNLFGSKNKIPDPVYETEIQSGGLVTKSKKYDKTFNSDIVMTSQFKQIRKAAYSGQAFTLALNGRSSKFGGSAFLQARAKGNLPSQKQAKQTRNNIRSSSPVIKSKSLKSKDPFSGLKVGKSGLFVRA